MDQKTNGKNLIFLISQPRAGSTLLQKVISNHEDVYTISEPWLMLNPLHIISENRFVSSHEKHKNIAFQNLINELPSGLSDYYETIRTGYSKIYDKLLAKNGKKIFLDKTPRYYLIIKELHETFPEAKFIFLIRHPLDVLNSIIDTWCSSNLFSLKEHKNDLFTALENFCKNYSEINNYGCFFCYEKFLSDPSSQLVSLFKYLGISYSEEKINTNLNQSVNWVHGDQTKIKEQKIDGNNTEKWRKTIKHAQKWRLFKNYLSIIGKEKIEILGYDFDENKMFLMENKPNILKLFFTNSLSYFIKERKPLWFSYFMHKIKNR